jgi:protein transport protein SEC24
MFADRSQKGFGGQVNIFQTTLPTAGPGTLKHREDTKLYGTDKEKTLFASADPTYRVIAEECVESGIGINLFLFPTQYIDVATLGEPREPDCRGGRVLIHSVSLI